MINFKLFVDPGLFQQYDDQLQTHLQNSIINQPAQTEPMENQIESTQSQTEREKEDEAKEEFSASETKWHISDDEPMGND